MINFKFKIEEVQLNLPAHGNKMYVSNNRFPINYAKNIYCFCKKEVNIETISIEDNPFVRYLDIQVTNSDYEFSDGSYAMKDILKSVASVYNHIALKITSQGAIIAIHNMDELQNKWVKVKEYVQNKYKGSYVDRFIIKTENILNSEKSMIEEISLYQNFGGLVKPLYQRFSSENSLVLPQILSMKYGKIESTEHVLLKNIKETGEVQLQLRGHYPENEKYVIVNGTYDFNGRSVTELQNCVISIKEKYGRHEYRSLFTII